MAGDSMNIGITGLDAYQAQIDVISNNIANVGTTAYKGQSLSFQDLLYQTQQPGSGPTKTSGGVNYQQVGIGVKIGGTDTNSTQGGVQSTGVNTNMMINGDGYFILKNADGTGTPQYTRNGDFSLNANGLLFDPTSGQGVMGYVANSAGVVALGTPSPIQIPIGLKSVATATGQGVKVGPTGDKMFSMSFAGNLDSTQYAAAVSAATTAAGTAATTSQATIDAAVAIAVPTPAISGTTIYDSLGNAHLMTMSLTPAVAVANETPATNPPVPTVPLQLPASVNNASGVPVTAATEYSYTMKSSDGTLFVIPPLTPGGVSTTSTTSAPQYVFFDQHGQYINTSADALGTKVHLAGNAPSDTPTVEGGTGGGNQLNVAQWGIPANATNAVNTTTGIGTPAPAPSGPIGIDFSGMTALGATAALKATYQDGYPPGIMTNMTVGTDGTITGSFTNGQSATIARVALASFQNEQGLLRVGGSKYIESVDSGQAQVGEAQSGSLGSITGNALELSNVSIGDEFTKLITAQNAFTANSKSITTANTDDQTVINLIR